MSLGGYIDGNKLSISMFLKKTIDTWGYFGIEWSAWYVS